MNRKKRYARRLSSDKHFKPVGIKTSKLLTNTIALDEFEAMRLVDHENINQVDAASEMEVSRATIQRLLTSGRRKVTDAILLNKGIAIKNDIENIKLRGENKVRMDHKTIQTIALPTSDRSTVDNQFGHTKEFAIFIIDGTKTIETKFVTPPKHEHGVFPAFLAENNVDVIITGGMGQMALNILKGYNIDVILGAKGKLTKNLNEYILKDSLD